MIPLNHSYVNRWIVDNFCDMCLVDTHLGKIFVHGDTKKQKIVIVDNEVFTNSDSFLPDFLQDSDNIYITKLNFFPKKQNLTQIIFPFFDILEDIFALNAINIHDAIKLIYPNKNNFSFLSLNRSNSDHRDRLINYLDKLDLLKNSYVTYHRPKKKIDYLKNPKFDWYKRKGAPDRVYNSYKSIPCTTNFVNYFLIKSRIDTSICLPIETTLGVFYPCEKSFLPFFNARIPIIISSQGHIDSMQTQGFDMFDDIVDKSYDKIKKSEERLTSAVDLNYDLLQNGLTIEEKIYKRLKKNFMHLKYDFFESQKQRLISEIEKYAK